MAIKADSWREHSMRIGATYVAVRTCAGALGARFHEGRRYTLTAIGHSHHDEATLLTFVENGAPEPLVWAWPDSDAPSLVDAHFQEAQA